jgi:rod shape-determining protein MreD
MTRVVGLYGRPPTLSLRARVVPVLSVLVASLLPVCFPLILQAPMLPPLGLMTLLAWRLLRPGLWPIWAALPLGLFDDLASGQPVGSAMLIWTLLFLAIDASERTLVWRDYLQDWLIAAGAIAAALVTGFLLALAAGGSGSILLIVPQLLASVLLFPAVARLCARLDQWRLR